MASLSYISTQPFSTTFKYHYKIISQGNGKCVAYTPCLKCHVHNKLTGLRRVYEGIGSLVCSILLLIAPVSNVLIRLCCQGRGTRDFIAGSDFLKPGKYDLESHTFAFNSFLFRRTSFKKVQYFTTYFDAKAVHKNLINHTFVANINLYI